MGILKTAVNMSFLEKILKVKRTEVARAKGLVPLEGLKESAQGGFVRQNFADKIRQAPHPAIIAEVKRGSPSKGIFAGHLDPVETATGYKRAGAACLSILTDQEFFAGSLEFLTKVREQVPGIALLRKDFIVDAYQIWESKAAGADAILLIVAALEEGLLSALFVEACEADLDVLVEVHNAEELELAMSLVSMCSKQDMPSALDRSTRTRLPLIGINNRNLHTFQTDLGVTEELIAIINARHIKSEAQSCAHDLLAHDLLIVSESGIAKPGDIARLTRAGARAFLIGESLLAQGDPGENLEKLIKGAR